jgi:hypothetical protein
LSNVLIGNTAAGISDNSVISKGSTTLSATNDTDIFKIATGGSVTGIGFDGGAYIMADVIDNDLRAYIENSTLSNNTAASVSATSTLDFTDVVISVGFTGVGASIMANYSTNVVKQRCTGSYQRFNNYKWSVSTGASQTTNIDAKWLQSAQRLSVAGAQMHI